MRGRPAFRDAVLKGKWEHPQVVGGRGGLKGGGVIIVGHEYEETSSEKPKLASNSEPDLDVPPHCHEP